MSKVLHNTIHYGHWVMIAGMMCSAVVLSAGAAVAVTPAFQAAAVGGEALKISIPNIIAALPDASWTMLEGLGDLPEVWEGLSNASEAGELWNYDYTFGLMDHGAAGHDMTAGAAAHGAHGGSELSSIFSDHGAAGHDAACGLDAMNIWEQSEPNMGLVDQEIANGSYNSRADYFEGLCGHDHG